MYDEHKALYAATQAGKNSPCAKSNRGVVIFRRLGHRAGAVEVGWNEPPAPMKCDGSDLCREHCNRLCVHAEMTALLRLLRQPALRLSEFEMLHVKVVDGKPVPSGPPSCWQCSRLILQVGLKAMWLLHEEGLRDYTPLEFHRLTLEHNGFL
jgi:deoxycytidylate deaminase